MRSEPVVIAGVGREDPAKLVLAEDDDVIEAFPADRADQSLRMPVLPGSASRLLSPPWVLMASVCAVNARDAKEGEHRHALGTTCR
jgi:hypothetical protein